MNRIISVFAIALTTLGLGACSAPSIDEQPAEEFATEGLHPVSGTGFESAYVLPAANLPQYTAIEFPPFSSADVEVTQTTVTGTSRSAWIMTPEKEAGLAQAWSNATGHAQPPVTGLQPDRRFETRLTHSPHPGFRALMTPRLLSRLSPSARGLPAAIVIPRATPSSPHHGDNRGRRDR